MYDLPVMHVWPAGRVAGVRTQVPVVKVLLNVGRLHGGHGFIVLHGAVCWVAPVQFLPPFLGAGLVHVRFWIIVAVPQVPAHVPLTHALHLPSTVGGVEHICILDETRELQEENKEPKKRETKTQRRFETNEGGKQWHREYFWSRSKAHTLAHDGRFGNDPVGAGECTRRANAGIPPGRADKVAPRTGRDNGFWLAGSRNDARRGGSEDGNDAGLGWVR